MKSILFFIILLLFAIGIKAQTNTNPTITGRVCRAGTDTIIPGATVYYGGSMTVTITDNEGNFKIQAKQQEIPVIVSCIGYYTATVNYQPGQPLKVNLRPKIEQLKMVTIRAGRGGGSGSSNGDGMSWKDKLALFTDEFIGTSEFAKSCVVTNIEDITLTFNKKAQTLVARCDNPIVIINKKLGYTITYFLDRFEKSPEKLAYTGTYNFIENGDFTNQEQIKENREIAYEGSRLQFIRALWHNSLAKVGYNVVDKKDGKRLTEANMVRDSLQKKYLHIDKDIYFVSRVNNSLLVLNSLKASSKTPFINYDGYYGMGLQWGGGMGTQRIGDLLPYEYQSEKDPE